MPRIGRKTRVHRDPGAAKHEVPQGCNVYILIQDSRLVNLSSAVSHPAKLQRSERVRKCASGAPQGDILSKAQGRVEGPRSARRDYLGRHRSFLMVKMGRPHSLPIQALRKPRSHPSPHRVEALPLPIPEVAALLPLVCVALLAL